MVNRSLCNLSNLWTISQLTRRADEFDDFEEERAPAPIGSRTRIVSDTLNRARFHVVILATDGLQ
jgi:hypothetical protein